MKARVDLMETEEREELTVMLDPLIPLLREGTLLVEGRRLSTWSSRIFQSYFTSYVQVTDPS